MAMVASIWPSRRNPDGGFHLSGTYATAAAAYAIALADLNGDGHPDLSVAYSDNLQSEGVGVFLNGGNGTFAPVVSYAAGDNPISIAAGDLDGDGHADLVVANYGTGPAEVDTNVHVLVNHGDGTFGAPAAYPTTAWMRSVALADLNGDHKPDLVVTDEYKAGVLRNKGDGTFGAQISYGDYVADPDLRVGDLDGDGYPDLVLSDPLAYGVGGWTHGNAVLLLNDGSGAFGAPINFPEEAIAGIAAISDLNGDGRADVVVSNSDFDCAYSLSVFLSAPASSP
jgi:hypothetical protein